MNTASSAAAGLGLFFVGMRLVGSHLQQLASGRIRSLLASTFDRPLVAPLAGFLSGALTQSTSASTFIATGLVSAGSLGLAAALAMLAAANVGTSVLVLLAAVDLRTLVLYMLAATGCAFFAGLDQAERSRHAVLAVLGLGLLLFGLSLLKASVAELRGDPWVREFVEFAASNAAVGLLAGFIIAVAVQSSSIVTVLALPLVNEGLLTFDQTIMMIYGANVGSGFAILLLASGLEGASRQLALCQALLRVLAATVLVPLFLLEQSADLPLVLAGLRQLADSPMTQSGLAYLLFQLVVATMAAVLSKPLLGLTGRLSPASTEQLLMQPAYLFDEAVEDPATALSLAQLEHARLVGFLPDFLDDLRPPEERAPTALPLAQRSAASAAVAKDIEDFLGSMVRTNPEMTQIQQVFDARSRVLALQTLQAALQDFTTQLVEVPAAERPPFADHMVEGLHAILMVAADVARDANPDDLDMLHVLTGERSAMMDRVRQELLGGGASIAGREALLSATLLFERILWMLRRLSPVESNMD